MASDCLYSCKQGMILNKFQILVKIILTCVRGVLLKNISWIPVLNKHFQIFIFAQNIKHEIQCADIPYFFFGQKNFSNIADTSEKDI